MVLEYFGKKESQEKLAELLHTSESTGTDQKELVSVAEQYGFSCFEKKDASIEDIRRFIAKNIPVIVNYIEPSENVGHYAVATAVAEDELILNDPWNGKDFRIAIPEFEKRWHDSSGEPQKWLLAISQQQL